MSFNKGLIRVSRFSKIIANLGISQSALTSSIRKKRGTRNPVGMKRITMFGRKMEKSQTL